MAYKGLNKEKHKKLLLKILIGIEKIVKNKIAFKGGTAAMLFFNLPRFSLDLDFDILKNFSDKEKEEIRALIQDLGQIRDFKDKNYTLFYQLDYEKYVNNLKIEFNRRIWENNNYKIVKFRKIPIIIQDEITMFTNKLIALTERKEPVVRDLFDINYFLKQNFPLSKPLIKERVHKRPEKLIDLTINFIKKNFNSKNVLQGVGELLEQKQKHWVKSNLISDTIKRLKKRKAKI
jgi:predicted nucleotidyltransferase component of viral defense system